MSQSRSELFVAPGAWLGLLGGGQLGRMFCHAAQSLGYRVAVLDPAEECPAGMVADLHIRAAYDDPQGLQALAQRCAAVTTEFENVPADSLRALAAQCRVTPSGDAVAVVQDRIAEKRFIAAQGIPVAPHAAVGAEADLVAAPDTLFPGILKVARLGYDGKGQARVANRQEALAAFTEFGGVPCVLEALLPLDHEISVVIARAVDGASVVFPIARNVHRDGILAVSTVGQDEGSALQAQARAAAQAIARGLDYHGVLCVEFFVLRDGSLVVNEIAPRPHNSGHYSMDACVTSQFEQQARVMAGLPLGSADLMAPVVMLNLLGDLWFEGETQREPDWSAALSVDAAKLHLYGKRDARHGRKMGHVNIVGATLDEARRGAARVAQALGLPDPDHE
ncbi:5-(carboxyamino)imidazole ribonucleotide synthase [Bordetella avium]|uniref:N5-carboxyaminoimidazole ribonucleotide synthase n=1 Tax=Bordetella avium (strain 197N) TaxID=360910 RepID=Q2KVZ9_BORA1|nr:5-(carboxyamino)imidazole ribonucleotide synthase [Bordetella avium]AZY51791.1 5-(carboxyamino)imidazole ribonucleotide synthase [Bordetella avium]RIQ13345.1 5-(carboxyamino)imidazole ribonucleotide synthase [Bordetella avium]RIQ16401.1 5-(carboxyamino)imidazole ribonucleotide synthase [Bordetella avium]RIQ31087.1 5-(carboxyamino)imidazole ribonucleotide synthase [Bordetella avium]RIQ35818.1 5-(carboxyamino)imidazole ribonucleotide synthase [Bordetella avium]